MRRKHESKKSSFAYMTSGAFAQQFGSIADKVASEVAFVRSLGRDTVKGIAFNMLRFAVLCTKHPGFFRRKGMACRRVLCDASLKLASRVG